MEYSKIQANFAQNMHVTGFPLVCTVEEPEVRVEPDRFDFRNLGVGSRFQQPGTGTWVLAVPSRTEPGESRLLRRSRELCDFVYFVLWGPRDVILHSYTTDMIHG